jgi:hypothetical protein
MPHKVVEWLVKSTSSLFGVFARQLLQYFVCIGSSIDRSDILGLEWQPLSVTTWIRSKSEIRPIDVPLRLPQITCGQVYDAVNICLGSTFALLRYCSG